VKRLVGCALLAAACEGQATSADSGLEAWLRVEGAQYVPGPLPRDSGTLEVASLEALTDAVRPGQVGKRFRGALAREARAVAIGLDGDRGHWIAVAGPPEVETPDFASFDVGTSFARDMPLGPRRISACALDARGRCGPFASRDLLVARGVPTGTFVISLSWARDADLDLHVVTPDGVEVFNGDPTTFQPPEEPLPPGEEPWLDGGILDFDSNAGCDIDGRRQENVVWQRAVPSGRYSVLVDTASLCGESHSEWAVEVLLRGAVVGRAEGTALPTDAELPHGRGSGVLALEVDVP